MLAAGMKVSNFARKLIGQIKQQAEHCVCDHALNSSKKCVIVPASCSSGRASMDDSVA
jgi:hypothetical protein